MSGIKSVIKKLWNFAFHTETGLYLVFGVLTTVVSLVVFYLFMWIYPHDLIGTVISNVAGILFAYFTNKGLVFGSKAEGAEKTKEFYKFVSSRLLTLGLDFLMMFVMTTLMSINGYIAKPISTVVVIILNYVLSKLFVFTKK